AAGGGQPVGLDLDRSAELALVRRGPRGRRTGWAIDRTTGDEQLLVPSGGPRSPHLRRPSARGAVARELHPFLAVGRGARGEPQSAVVLAERADADLDHIALTASGREAILLWNVAGESVCERIDLETRERVDPPPPEPVARDCSFSHDGRCLAMTLEGPTAPRAVWRFDGASGQWSRVTGQRPGWRAPLAPAPPRRRRPRALGLALSPGGVPRSGAGRRLLPWRPRIAGASRLQSPLPGPRRPGHRRLRAQRARLVGVRALVRECRQPRQALGRDPRRDGLRAAPRRRGRSPRPAGSPALADRTEGT